MKRLQLLTICAAQVNEAIQVTLPYTVAVYMVRHFESLKAGSSADEETIGYLTGILAACFCAAQFFSSYPWGWLSDRVGRKPLLLMSNMSSFLAALGFGLSTSFPQAAICRILGGFFNCTFMCIKTMIGESCGDESQAVPLSYISLCWGLGSATGPTLGGLLAIPCETFGPGFPLCGAGQLMRTRPFLLPCLTVALISLAAFLASLFLLEETLPSKVASRYLALKTSDLPRSISNRAPSGVESEMAELRSHLSTDESAMLQSPGGEGKEESKEGCEVSSAKRSGQPGFDPALDVEAQTKTRLTEDSPGQPGEEAAWYKSNQVLLIIFAYGMICLLCNLLDEMTPMFSSAPRHDGGLGLSPSQLAVPLAFSGAAILLASLLLYPRVHKRLGSCGTYRLGLVAIIPLSAAITLPSFIQSSALVAQLLLTPLMCVKNVAAMLCFTSAMLVVNLAAPRNAIGSVNGASQAVAAFARAAGPALGGAMWALAVSLPVFGHQSLPFVGTAFGFLAPLAVLGFFDIEDK